jgi:hypothetical protein
MYGRHQLFSNNHQIIIENWEFNGEYASGIVLAAFYVSHPVFMPLTKYKDGGITAWRLSIISINKI